MARYVAGFLFTNDGDGVVLIEKNKPDWQKGRLNAVGGKIEAFETAIDAMHREFQEEAGVVDVDWRRFAVLGGKDFTVHFFYARDSGKYLQAHSKTDEEIGCYSPILLPDNVLPNVPWLIQMALSMEKESCSLFEITERP